MEKIQEGTRVEYRTVATKTGFGIVRRMLDHEEEITSGQHHHKVHADHEHPRYVVENENTHKESAVKLDSILRVVEPGSPGPVTKQTSIADIVKTKKKSTAATTTPGTQKTSSKQPAAKHHKYDVNDVVTFHAIGGENTPISKGIIMKIDMASDGPRYTVRNVRNSHVSQIKETHIVDKLDEMPPSPPHPSTRSSTKAAKGKAKGKKTTTGQEATEEENIPFIEEVPDDDFLVDEEPEPEDEEEDNPDPEEAQDLAFEEQQKAEFEKLHPELEGETYEVGNIVEYHPIGGNSEKSPTSVGRIVKILDHPGIVGTAHRKVNADKEHPRFVILNEITGKETAYKETSIVRIVAEDTDL